MSKWGNNQYNPLDSNTTNASKLSNYVNNGKFVTIVEGQIVNLKQDYTTPTTITITFEIVGYPTRINFTLVNHSNPADTNNFSTLRSPYTFEGLNKDTDYDITATAVYVSGNTYPFFAKRGLKTINEGPAFAVQYSTVTNHTAILTFSNAYGGPNMIQLTITNTNNPVDRQVIENFRSGSIIRDLERNANYNVKLKSRFVSTGNEYIYFLQNAIQTLNEDLPIFLQTSNIRNNSVTIEYDVVGSPTYNFLTLTNVNNNADIYQTENIVEKTVIFDAIGIDQTYTLDITSVYTTGNLFTTTILNAFATLTEDSPKNISILNTTGDTVYFSFDPAIGNPVQYTATLTNQNALFPNDIITRDFSGVIITQGLNVTNLKHNSYYSFIITSIYSDGNQYTTAPITIQTLNEGVVTTFSIQKIENTNIIINVINTIGDSLYYEIRARNVYSPIDQVFFTSESTNSIITIPKLSIHNTYILSVTSNYTRTNNRYTYTYVNPVTTLNEGPSILSSVGQTTTTTSTSLILYSPYGIPIDYQLFFSNVSSTTGNIVLDISGNGSDHQSVVVTNLIPNTAYNVTVRNRYFNSLYQENHTYLSSPGFLLKTKAIPAILSYQIITDVSASLNFTTPLVSADAYRLIENGIITDISSSNLQFNTLPTISTLIIPDLVANTAYDISFVFYYQDINTSYSSFFHIDTKGPAQNIEYLFITDTSANIAFTSSLVVPENYTVTIVNNNQNVYSNTSRNTTFIVSDLSPNTIFSLAIRSNYIDQNYTKYSTFITKDKPRNIVVSSITDVSASISFTTLNATPDYYYLTYNQTLTVIPNTHFIRNLPLVPLTTNYILPNLLADSSYSNLSIGAHYNDISYTFVSDISPVFYTKSAPQNINVDAVSNGSARINITTPIYTSPDYYILHFLDTVTIPDVSFSSTRKVISNLVDNTNYNFHIISVYISDTIRITSENYSFQTHGTPNIINFTNIYDTYATIIFQNLLIPPTKYRITLLDTNTKRTLTRDFYPSDVQTSLSSGSGSNVFYTLPVGFLTPNSLYNTTLSSYYPEAIYTSDIVYIDTKAAPTITNVISTDISSNVYFNFPFVNPDNIHYSIYFNNTLLFTKTNTPTFYDPSLFNYFTVSNLTQNTNYTVIATSVYSSDVSYNIVSVPFTFQTEGPPTNLAVDPRNISNTQFIITFDLPYNTRNYTVYVTDVATSTIINYNILGISVSPYKVIDLSENTLYSVYVTSNYIDHSFSSNIVEVRTLSGLQIQSIQNISDTTAQVIINNPANNPDFFSYNIQIEGGTLSPAYPIPNTDYIDIDANTTQLNISGLSPNSNYVRFSVNEYYSGTDTTLVSNNFPFNTLGISNITNIITDISATFQFKIPYTIPLNYYYRSGTDLNYYLIPVQTSGPNTIFTISNVLPNTFYDSFTVYMNYNANNNPDDYIIQSLPFVTKQKPIITNTIVSDTTITVFFTSILANVSKYTYRIQAENGALNVVDFTPIKNPNTGLSSITILNLITNTYYSTFQIDVYYSDINQTFTSTNITFSTLGPVFNPRIALTSDPNRNTITFYPPISKPDYYLISNPFFDDTGPMIVYDTSMTYFGNQYFYDVLNVFLSTGYIGIDVVPFFSSSSSSSSGTGTGTTFANTNLVKNLNIRILNGLIDLATNQSGSYISVCENASVYVSSDYGNTWTTNNFNTNISKVIMDASGKNQYALYSGNPSFIYVSNNYGSSWVRKSVLQGNRLSTIATDISGQNVFAGGLGGSFNYMSNDFGNTWVIDANTDHSENSIGCIMNDNYIYTINSITNSIIQISKSMSNNATYQSITIPNFTPQFIVSNQKNTRFIVAGLPGIYISKDGISWTPTVSSVSGYNWVSLSCDIECIRAIAVANGIGILITEDGGLNWNVILPVFINLKQATISGDGKKVYVTDFNQTFYSYVIPDTKGNVRNVTATTVTNTSLKISAFPPFITPNLVYDISAINTIAPNDIVSVSSIAIENVTIPNLTADGSYNIVITANYTYPRQSFINTPFAVYTKEHPSNFQRFGNPTDISAVFQFQSPKVSPTKYILQDSSGLYQDIYFADCISINSNERILQYTLNGLISNTFYPNFQLSSYYADISTAYTSIESVSFFTRGPVIDVSINTLLDVSLNLSFQAPPNTTDISSNAYTIIATNTVPPLETNIYYSSGNTTNLPLSGLSPDGSYNIIVTTNYENPVQNLASTVLSTYTKSAPLGVRAEPNYITDTSGILQFQPPKILPDYYRLDISNVITDNIPLSEVFLQDGSSSIVYNSFLPNTKYLSNISLISYYVNTNSQLYSTPISSVITEGPPTVNSVALDISNGAILSFTPPYVFPTLVRFQIYDNILNILDYDFSQSTTQDIAIPDLSYNITYRVVPSSIYTNKTIPGSPYFFSSRSPPLSFQTNINATTDSSVSSTFIAPINIPSRYEMTIINNDTRIFSLANTLTSFIIDDLSANTYYSLRLQSIYDISGYLYTPLRLSTNIINFYTKGPARNITVASLTDTKVIIQFDPPYIYPTQFIAIIQNQDPLKSLDTQTLINISSPFTMDNLTPNAVYLVTLQSVYANIMSSTTLTIITQSSPTITTIDPNTITDQSVTIPFLACLNIPTSYQLVLKNPNDQIIQTITKIPANAEASFLVSDLSANQVYSVVIKSIYSVANNEIYNSNLVSFYTKSSVINIQTPENTVTSNSSTITFQNAYVIPPNPYKITINNDNRTVYYVNTVNTPAHTYSFSLTNLVANAFYSARIDSLFENITINNTIVFVTESPPIDISINPITDVSGVISFQPCNNTNATYTLTCQNNENSLDFLNVEIRPIAIKTVQNENITWNGGIFLSQDETYIIVYSVSRNLFTISMDAGNTWSVSTPFIMTTTDILYSFAVTSSGRYIYSSNTGIYYSSNGAVSWQKSNAPTGISFTLLQNNRAGNIAIAVANTNVYYSANYGETWNYSDALLPSNATKLTISADGNLVYLLAGNLFKSMDQGKTWINIVDINNNNYQISTINNMFISVNGTFIYMVTNSVNVYISLDSGNTFNVTNHIVSNVVDSTFTFSVDGKYGYQLNIDGFFYYSTDYGQTWINPLILGTNPSNTLLKISDSGNYAIYSNQDISGIQMIYRNPVRLVNTITNIYEKNDSIWNLYNTNDVYLYNYISSNGNFLLNCYTDNNHGSSQTYYNGFVYSNDYGNTWTERMIYIDNNDDMIHAFCGNENGYFLYTTDNKGYISSDFGNTWTICLSGMYISKICNDETGKYIIAVIINPISPNNPNHILYSIDYGVTWNNGSVIDINSVIQMYISRNANYSYILGFTANNTYKLLKSTDYGETWNSIWNDNLNITNNNIYMVASALGNFLYISVNNTTNQIVTFYKSDNYGQTFSTLNTIPDINSRFYYYIRTNFYSFSNDGRYGVQYRDDGYFYFSNDYGITWTNSMQTFVPYGAIYYKDFISRIQMSDDGTFAITILSSDSNQVTNSIVRINNDRNPIPYPCPFIYNYFTADSVYLVYLTSIYTANTPVLTYNSDTITVSTKSAPNSIQTLSDFTNVTVSFAPPNFTEPINYTIYLYDNRFQLYKTGIVASSDNNVISGTITDLSVNTYYNVTVASNYSGNIGIISSPSNFYTLFNPILDSIYYTINSANNTFTITVNYRMSRPPLYYLMKIEYPKVFMDPPDNTIIDTENSIVDIYDTNQTSFSFFNLNTTGNYIVTISAVYSTYSYTLDTSTNIYVNTTVPVSLDSYVATANTITVNYTITDPTTGVYTLHLINTSFPFPDPVPILPNNQTTYTHTGLTQNSGSYQAYISTAINGGIYNSNRVIIPLIYTPPIVTINDISMSGTYNAITTKYSIQNSYNTLYTLVLTNTMFDICYNVRVFSYNTTSTFPNLYYNSGTYNSYIRVKSVNNIYTSNIATITVPDINPIAIIPPITAGSNSILLVYTLYNTYRSVYQLHIVNTAISDISYNVAISNNSSNYTFSPLSYYNLGSYYVYMDVSYVNARYFTPTNTTVSTIYQAPITIGNIYSITNTTTNSITVPFIILPSYQSNMVLTMQNRTKPELSSTISNITNSMNTHTFSALYYNSGIYDISMTMYYTGVSATNNTISNQKYTTTSQSITLSNVNLITISNITKTNNSIKVPFRILPPYQGIYTLYAKNTAMIDLSYSITTITSSDTSYNFTNLFYNSGTYNIYMVVKYKDANNADTSYTTPTSSVSLVNVSPIVVRTISQTANSITVPYTLYPVNNPTYTINAINTTIPALSKSAPLSSSTSILTSSYTFSNLYNNSGSYNVSITVTYNNGASTFTTTSQTITLATANPVTITAISKTSNTIDVSYSFLNVYNPFYTIYVNNTTTPDPALSYSDNTLPITVTHYKVSNMFYNSGTYSVYIALSYMNGLSIFTTPVTPVSSTNSATLSTVIPITLGTVITGVSNNFNTITVPYSLFTPIYNATYTIYATNAISALTQTYILSTPIVSSSSYNFTGIFYNSGNYDISMVLTQNGLVTYTAPSQRVTFSGSDLASIGTVQTTTDSITVPYSILPAYNATYILYAIPLDASVGNQPITLTNNVYTGSSTFSSLTLGSGRYNIYIIVTYGPGSQTFTSTSVIATLQAITPIIFNTTSSDYTSITATFTLLPVSNAVYTITATNQENAAYTYYSFTDNTLTSYTFPNLPYNSGNYTITLGMTYNNSSTFSTNTVVSVQNYYGAIGTVSSVVPSYNSLNINYSVVSLINPTCNLYVTNSSIGYNYSTVVSATNTSFTLNNLTSNSGTYSVYLSINIPYISYTYTSNILTATLLSAYTVINGTFSSPTLDQGTTPPPNNWTTTGNAFTVINGNNRFGIKSINNNLPNILVLQLTNSSISQNIYFVPGNYTITYNYIKRQSNTTGVYINMFLGNTTIDEDFYIAGGSVYNWFLRSVTFTISSTNTYLLNIIITVANPARPDQSIGFSNIYITKNS